MMIGRKPSSRICLSISQTSFLRFSMSRSADWIGKSFSISGLQ